MAVSLTSFLRNGLKTATDPKDAGQSFIIAFKVLKPFLWVVFRFFLLERQSKMASVWPAESFRFVLGSAYNAFTSLKNFGVATSFVIVLGKCALAGKN